MTTVYCSVFEFQKYIHNFDTLTNQSEKFKTTNFCIKPYVSENVLNSVKCKINFYHIMIVEKLAH